ncbi:MAG: leucine-rich repeat protein [Bacteroidales bacterium]|nr:leucine-rich repeat protein [Bacteroidales bacterium]
MIEQNTNYAYKLKYMDKPSFDKVRDLSVRFYRELPQALQDELFDALNRGVDILDSEPQMTAYLFAFGKMHQAKLNHAFGKLPEEFLEQEEINIIDYGCGQALGTMCYADFLRENGYAQKVKTITLIEPSEICLKRAALHVSMFFPEAKIKTVNKKFDDLTEDDIVCSDETPTLHILSNVLDMLDFDLDRFAELVNDRLNGNNLFVCSGPYFNYSDKDDRMIDFCRLLGGNAIYSKVFDKYEFKDSKTWTAHFLCFAVGELSEVLSTEVTVEEIKNGVQDEYGAVYSRDGKKLLSCFLNKVWKTYVIKEGTHVICDRAFGDICQFCSYLQQIIIPDSVTSIGVHAFEGCCSLQQIIIPDSVSSIGNGAFDRCSSIQQIAIPDSVTTIEDGTFVHCDSLQQIAITASVTTIGNGAFSSCSSLQQIIIPDSVTSIGNSAFWGCSSLRQITIPDSVTSIGNYAFRYCNSLQQIAIPTSVTTIGDGTFCGCDSLQQIIIPDSVTSIGYNAFGDCGSLQRIIISKGSMEKFKHLLLMKLWDKLCYNEKAEVNSEYEDLDDFSY